jgi:hypothetical protein
MRRLAAVATIVAGAMFGVPPLWLTLHPPPAVQHWPVFVGAKVDASALKLFERACLNCHSENTDWPWYSRLPPASFLIRRDVEEARRHVNFTNWGAYSAAQQQELLSMIGVVVRTGRMPVPRYTRLHPEARLTDEEREQIYAWSRKERKRLWAKLVSTDQESLRAAK